MYKHLTSERRYAIFCGRQKKLSIRAIAQLINVSPSTVCRELKRNSTERGKYIWTKADEKAVGRKRRCPGNHTIDSVVKWRVKELIMEEQWSPKQISGSLAKENIHISHETIYRMIRSDESGRLATHCRHRMKYTRKTKPKHHETKATNIKNRVSIHERPVEADGKRFGDWEMDLVVDKYSHALLTLIERSTNYLLMAKLKHNKAAMPLAKEVRRLLLPFKGKGVITITTDNGSEFAAHEWITEQLGAQVYFTDAYSSWQKGAVENTNKLVRQYIPKGTDISTITDRFVAKIQAKINRRPREKLNYSTPKTEFYKHYS